MSQYEKAHYYAPDSYSTHHHYYAGHSGPPYHAGLNIPHDLSPPPPPPREPRRGHRPWDRARLNEHHPAHQPAVEVREPVAYAYYGDDVSARYFVEYRSIHQHPPAWYLQRAGRHRASPEADHAHSSMERDRRVHFDITHSDETCAEEFKSGLHLRYDIDLRSGPAVSSSSWQRSGTRQCADEELVYCMAAPVVRKERDEARLQEYIRLRGEEKAWVKRKESKVKRVRRVRKSDGRGRREVNDVECKKVATVYESGGVARETWVRFP